MNKLGLSDVFARYAADHLFSEPEVFEFPEGIGPVECVNVEHEEVLLVPRWKSASGLLSNTGLATNSSKYLRLCTNLG